MPEDKDRYKNLVTELDLKFNPFVRWQETIEELTDIPRGYIEMALIHMTQSLIGRFCEMTGTPSYVKRPNDWLVACGLPTITRKSSCKYYGELMKDNAIKGFYSNVYQSDEKGAEFLRKTKLRAGTPEGIVDNIEEVYEMSKINVNSNIYQILEYDIAGDEFGHLLKKMLGHHYESDKLETMVLIYYGSPWSQPLSKRTGNKSWRHLPRGVYSTALGYMQKPSNFITHQSFFESGLARRILMSYEHFNEKDYKNFIDYARPDIEWIIVNDYNLPGEIVKVMLWLFKLMFEVRADQMTPYNFIPIHFTPSVGKRISKIAFKYEKDYENNPDESIKAMRASMGEHIGKTACSYCMRDLIMEKDSPSPFAFIVKDEHLDKALEVINDMNEKIEEPLEHVGERVRPMENINLHEIKVMKLIRKHADGNGWAKHSNVLQGTRMPAHELAKIVDTLVESDKIVKKPIECHGKIGHVYKLKYEVY